jgi:hypothetical protein
MTGVTERLDHPAEDSGDAVHLRGVRIGDERYSHATNIAGRSSTGGDGGVTKK